MKNMAQFKKGAILGMFLFSLVAEARMNRESDYSSKRQVRREIVIPEQRYIFETDENGDDGMKDLKNMLELADLVAYESDDGEVTPTYIGHHKANLNSSNDIKKRN